MHPFSADAFMEPLPSDRIGTAFDSKARGELDAPREQGRRGASEREPIEGAEVGQQRTNRPFGEHIVAKGHAVAAEIAQALASNQRINCSGREILNLDRASPLKHASRHRPHDPRAFPAPLVWPIGGVPPLPRHVDFRALGIGSAAGRKSREPKQITRDLLRRVSGREQWRQLRRYLPQFADLGIRQFVDRDGIVRTRR